MPTKDSKPNSIHNGFSLISNEKLLALYAALLKCRMLSRRMGRGHAQREASIAAAVGAAVDLLPRDRLAASGSGVLARFAKGTSLRRILSLIGSNHRSSHAAALKSTLRAALRKGSVDKGEKGQRQKGAQIAVAFCDDASAPAEAWRESLREAASKRLPILFVCCAAKEAEHVESFAPKSGFPVIVVDCNDVVAIYRVASEAIAHARRGNGPTLIVCRPWPLSERRSARAHDPGDAIVTMENYLARKGLFSAEFKRKTISEFARELRAAMHPIT
jgi:hypothetical protein